MIDKKKNNNNNNHMFLTDPILHFTRIPISHPFACSMEVEHWSMPSQMMLSSSTSGNPLLEGLRAHSLARDFMYSNCQVER